MPDFTTLFKKYADDNEISDRVIAEAADLSRPYINKIKNGKQVCKKDEKMMKAIECLQLDQNAENELKTAYYMQFSDNSEYMVTDAVFRFIKSFSCIAAKHGNWITSQESYRDNQTYQSRENVAMICRKLIEEEACRQNGHLRLLMQPVDTQIQEAVEWGLRNHKNFLVEQMVGLGKMSDNNYAKKNNIDLLRQIVPVSLNQQSANYKVYYHYEWMNSYLSSYRMLQNILITSEQVLVIDDDFTNAILWTENCTVSYFKRNFDERIRRAGLLYDICHNYMDVYANLTLDAAISCPVYTMGSQPCFDIMANDTIFQKYAIDFGGDTIQRLLEFNQKIMRRKKSAEKVVSYFTQKGIKEFLETGQINKIPKELYRPLEVEDRRQMIQSLIVYAKEKSIEPHLINENNFHEYPMGLMINCYNRDDIVVSFHNEYVEKTLLMKEISLSNCIYYYMEWIRKEPYVYTVEETLEYLEDVLAGRK